MKNYITKFGFKINMNNNEVREYLNLAKQAGAKKADIGGYDEHVVIRYSGVDKTQHYLSLITPSGRHINPNEISDIVAIDMGNYIYD